MGRRNHIRGVVVRFELPWYVFTVAFYGVALVLLVVAFPDVSNLWVSIFVLVSGFTASMGTLVTAIKATKPQDD